MLSENIAFCSAVEIKILRGILKFLCVLFIKNKGDKLTSISFVKIVYRVAIYFKRSLIALVASS